MSDPRPGGGHVEESEPDVLQIAMVGIIGTLLLLIVVAVLQGLYEQVQAREYARKVVQATPQELAALRVRQMEALSAIAWSDPQAGAVTLPIDRAMELIARDPTLRAVPLPVQPPAAAKAAP